MSQLVWCTNSVPESTYNVLVTVIREFEPVTRVGYYTGRAWRVDGRWEKEVIAWAPMPEPYRREII